MSDHLPPELYPVILLKLPIKTLIKCTSVCKQWLSIITSPAFVSGHLSLSRQNPLLLTAPTVRTHDPSIFALHSDTDPPPALPQTLRFPFPTRKNIPFRVVGSVDGLVLLSDDHGGDTYTTVLWNPSIRRSVTLPKPRFNDDEVGPHSSNLGFGVDSASNDYKVVRVAYLKDPEIIWYKTPPLVEVFSLRDGSWRTVSSTNVDYLLLPIILHQCFIHGAVHWIGCNQIDTGILLFDLGKEEFAKMALPEGEEVVTPCCLCVSVIGGMLSVSFHYENPDVHRINLWVNIWVKRDYFADSWTKILSLDVKKLELGVLLHLRTVCGGGDARDWRDIQVPLLLGFEGVISYTESLVLLDEDRAVHEVGKALEKTQLGTNAA